MPSKQQLDKEAWGWIDTTEPDQVTLEHVKYAYHINLPPCETGSCKRNCRGNPFCLNGIGERVWLGQIDERKWHDIEDPNNERRSPESYVGLKNLGATCYVNTFLQLWFHNQQVRRAVYQWRSRDGQPPKRTIDPDWMPSTICGHLQLIFALLEFSKQRYIDPSNFIKHLGLNTAQQQDAQEFSKLFLSLLEETLMQSDNPKIKNVIEEQFSGEYAYITCCSHCGGKSKTPSKFYELDLNIRGSKTLHDCLAEFLQEEKLEGDNKYMCSQCKTKQNAIRTIQLQKLPPVLNLQLLRFVFDKQNGQKKKLNSYIQFPEVLDITEYLKDSEAGEASKPVVYDLSAVLIHRGISAYSGHYIAHIKDRSTQAWYKFNDEETERMQGRNLHLGNEEEVHIQEVSSTASKSKAPRLTKGFHSSRNAYMLVYIKRTTEEKAVYPEAGTFKDEELLPAHVREYVLMDNRRFENWIQELLNMRDQSVESGRERQEEIKYVYYSLVPKGNCLSVFEWMSLDWLSRWLTDPMKAQSINNESFLCCHSRLNPNKVSKLKFVNSEGAAALFAKFMGGPRLLGEDSLCLECVQQQCHVMRTKQKMEKDMKFITNIMKFNHDTPECYWVGKSSFRSWRRLMGEKLEEVKKINAEEQVDTKPVPSSEDFPSGTSPKCDSTWPEGNSFNNDLLCYAHRALNPDISCRRLVPREVWEILRSYFPKCPEFQRDGPVCARCVLLSQVEQQAKDQNKEWAMQQKSVLHDLYHDKSRPNNLNIKTHVYVVSMNFVEEWRRAVRDPVRRSPVTTVKNSALICVHGGMLYEPDLNIVTLGCQSITYLWPEEWTFIEASCIVDVEIGVYKQQADSNGVVGQPNFICQPALCNDCVVARLQYEEQQRFEYTDAKIYVRKVLKDWQQLETTMGYTNLGKTSSSSSSSSSANDKDTDKDDPEFIQSGGKRTKLLTHTELTVTTASTTATTMSAAATITTTMTTTTTSARTSTTTAASTEAEATTVIKVAPPPLRPSSLVTSTTGTDWFDSIDDDVIIISSTFAAPNTGRTIDAIPISSTAIGAIPTTTIGTGVIPTSAISSGTIPATNAAIRTGAIPTTIAAIDTGTIPTTAIRTGAIPTTIAAIRTGAIPTTTAAIRTGAIPTTNAAIRTGAIPITTAAICTGAIPTTTDAIGTGAGTNLATSVVPPTDNGKLTMNSAESAVRRSHRHRRMRGEKEVMVSSTQTLRDLKLQIMKLFSVPPFDQNLHFSGTCLVDETATLGNLRISPGCVIFLKADEPPQDAMVVEDILTASDYGEEGFKGTSLLSG